MWHVSALALVATTFFVYFIIIIIVICLSNSLANTFTGLLNLRGSDFAYLPVFFAYGIITEKECHLYLQNHERGKSNKVNNHFQIELIDVDIKEYNETLTGINMVVSYNASTDSLMPNKNDGDDVIFEPKM